MKKEMPPSITIAPTEIAAIPLPLRLPVPFDVVIGATVVGVVTVGVGAGDTGNPGLKGFVSPG